MRHDRVDVVDKAEEPPMTTWMLLDYGEVISRPQSAEAVSSLAALAGQEPARFRDRYWRYRPTYDRGQLAHDYWGAVLDRSLSPDDPLVGELTRIDVESWSDLDPAVLRMIEEAGERQGLALLSNAPEPMAAAIDRAAWAQPFAHRFYSCRFGLAKPDAALFRLVLESLEAAPEQVTFLDDRAENVEAAAALGINAILHRADGRARIHSRNTEIGPAADGN
jgi:putative hydrolase of the HAD superfamily